MSNDDGIFYPGLQVLVDIFAEGNEIYVVAPDREKSAVSNAITISNPVYTESIDFPNTKAAYKSSGTPADCIKLAVCALKMEPDVIISGINKGPNCGVNITYSGTVAAAMEGYYMGIPSFAASISNHQPPDFTACRAYMRTIVEDLLNLSSEGRCLFNINIPSCNSKFVRGIRLTNQTDANYSVQYMERLSHADRAYWQLAWGEFDYDAEESTDWRTLRNGYISITPLVLDLTDYQLLTRLKDISICNLGKRNVYDFTKQTYREREKRLNHENQRRTWKRRV